MAGCERSGTGCSRRSACSAGRTETASRCAQSLSSPCGWRPSASSHWWPWSGMSDSSSSSTIWRDFFARRLSVSTFMPGVTLRQQLAASARSPATSTTQARQLPSGRSGSLWHRCGSSVPWRFAASKIDSPS